MMKIRIISGLPLEKRTSFTYQICSLAGALQEAGAEVAVHSAAEYSGDAAGTIRVPGDDRIILLGYPDQFPFLCGEGEAGEAPGGRLYLWAQFSKPVDPAALGPALPVPLTEKTARILRLSGVERIGPVIPHGVDTTVFRQKEGRTEARDRAAITVGSVGANNRRKRWDSLFETFALFCSRYAVWTGADEAAEAAPAGRTGPVLKPRLRIKTDKLHSPAGWDLGGLARQYGIEKCIEIITADLSPADMVEFYRSLDLFVLLSEWEGFGIPVIEAMACGIPVITQDIQGPGETVPYRELLLKNGSRFRDDETVLYHGDPEEAADMMVQVLSSSRLYRRVISEGLEVVRRQYDIVLVAKKWLSLLCGN